MEGRPPPPAAWIGEAGRFKARANRLARQPGGANFASAVGLQAIADFVAHGRPLPLRPIAVTVDDGWTNFLLDQLKQVPAGAFVAVDARGCRASKDSAAFAYGPDCPAPD